MYDIKNSQSFRPQQRPVNRCVLHRGNDQRWHDPRDVHLLGEQRLYFFHDLTWSGIPKAVRVNNFPVIHIDTELPESTPYRLHLYVVFLSQSGCHTGSHHLLDGSQRAVMNDYSFHGLYSPLDETSISVVCRLLLVTLLFIWKGHSGTLSRGPPLSHIAYTRSIALSDRHNQGIVCRATTLVND